MKLSSFEIDNAKNMPKNDVVNTFVATDNFWRITAPKNQVVLGSRGSGKTALGKMLSHDYLSGLDDAEAKRIIAQKRFVGIYLPTNVEWIGGLVNKKWMSPEDKCRFFEWRMNIALAHAFLNSIESCIKNYSDGFEDKLILENKAAKLISSIWFDDECSDLAGIRDKLYLSEIDAEINVTKHRMNDCDSDFTPKLGEKFSVSLFSPIKWAIRRISDLFEFKSNTYWIVCIDEAEFLEPEYQKIINTMMRGRASEPTVYFKMITMPFCHYTLATNVESPLSIGHDFDYVYIDQDPVKKEFGQRFVRKLFEKRIKKEGDEYKDVTLLRLLGHSEILGNKELSWGKGSEELKMLYEYASSATIDRANKLLSSGDNRKFRDQVGRKIYPALLMRKYHKKKKKYDNGIYSGEAMLVRCGDGNPRRIIRLVNAIVKEAIARDWRESKEGEVIISKAKQEKVFKSFAKGVLFRVRGEPEIGPEMFSVINAIGNYMNKRLYKSELGTEQVFSISMQDSPPKIILESIRRAVGLGLIFPHIHNQVTENDMSSVRKFRLAYVLAPHFGLIPRRGRTKSVINIMNETGFGKKLLATINEIEICIV